MFDRNLMKLEGTGPLMGCLGLFALVQAALVIAQAVFLSKALAGLWAGTPPNDALRLILGFFASFALLQAIRFLQDQILERFARNACAALRTSLFERSFNPADNLIATVGATRISLAATTGMQDVSNYLRIIPPKPLGLALTAIPLLAFSFVNDWPSGVILAVMFPVIIFFMVLLGKQSKQRAERQYESYLRLSNRFIDTLRGLDVILASGAKEAESKSVFEFSERLRKATVKTLSTATLSSAVLDLCATFGVAAVAMMLAFRLMDGSISLETGLCALIVAPEFFTPIRSFAGDFHASLDGKNALADILELTKGNDTPSRATESASRSAKAEPPGCLAGGSQPDWTPGSKISFQDVSFSYDGASDALSHVTLELGGFQNVAIIGPSGSGKSTFASLAAGLSQPTNGRVSYIVEGTPIPAERMRKAIRYIPQSPTIFRMTLRDNVSLYNPHAADAQILDALAKVGLAELLDELPCGLDSLVGDAGRQLSGGEAHRIALARVLVDPHARILVFDEPTSHLDAITEYELKQDMLGLFEGKLVLFATHRRHWIAQMDRLIVLDRGTIAKDEKVSAHE